MYIETKNASGYAHNIGWSCTVSRGDVDVVLGNTTPEIHCILDSSMLDIYFVSKILEYRDNVGTFQSHSFVVN